MNISTAYRVPPASWWHSNCPTSYKHIHHSLSPGAGYKRSTFPLTPDIIGGLHCSSVTVVPPRNSPTMLRKISRAKVKQTSIIWQRTEQRMVANVSPLVRFSTQAAAKRFPAFSGDEPIETLDALYRLQSLKSGELLEWM